MTLSDLEKGLNGRFTHRALSPR